MPPARPDARPGAGADAGFTLLEVLAAVAVAGALLSAIGTVVAVTMAGLRSVPDRVTLTAAGQTLLAGLPQGDALRPGTTTGLLGTTRWRIDVTPLPDPPHPRAETSADPAPPPPWRPAAVAIVARSPHGRALRLDTIALIRRAGP